MKHKATKSEERLLHQLLDGVETEPATASLADFDAERLSRYRESLERLEKHQEKAPDDFVSRVMGALPDKPHLAWSDRLKSFWPERRLWPVPALSGALAMLILVAGLTLFYSSRNAGLIPVVLDLYAPSAKQVELVGTFSNWMPKAFRLKGPDAVGYWAIAVKLPPGRYEYAFLINGSQVVPDDDGEELRPDGLGQKNSLLLLRSAPRQLDREYGFTSDEYVTLAKNDPDEQALPLTLGNRDQWQVLLDRGVAAGVNMEALEKLLSHLANANINPEQARTILEPLIQDAQANDDTRYIFLKIHECILKKALPETFKAIAKSRYEAFKKASALLAQTGYEVSTDNHSALLNATAFALESGQDPTFLRDILSAGKGKSFNRVTAVIEAGETLYYAGLEPEIIKLIMEDCLRKDLESQQMKRITDLVEEKLRDGTDHKTIRNKLWI
jgi:hypothetical protein